MSVSLQALAAGRSRVAARIADYAELTKPRITHLVVLTTWVGYMLGAVARVDPVHALHTLLGTGLVCSGTTSKQIDRESHCRPVGFGAMLAEAFVALIALVTIMVAAPAAVSSMTAGQIYGQGIGRFDGFEIPKRRGPPWPRSRA